MKHLIWILIAGMAATARAQDSINPVHVLDSGEAFVDYGLRFNVNRSLDEDALGTRSHHALRFDEALFHGGIGFGGVAEVEASFPMVIGGLSPDVSTSEDGFGDLRLDGNFRIGGYWSETHGMVGAILVAPTGNEHTGIGDGAWKYGGQAGVFTSTLGWIRPYVRAEYVIGVEHKVQNAPSFSVDPSDNTTLNLGAEFPLNPEVTFDLRAILVQVGKEEFSSDLFGGVTSEEDAHRRTGLEGRLYLNAGQGGTMVVGAGVLMTERHDTGGGDSLIREADYFVAVSIFVPVDTRPADYQHYGR